MSEKREGSVEAPTRHPLGQNEPEFWDPDALHSEMERVFDICHGCRRCFSLCESFPILFDAIDDSETMEVDGIGPETYAAVAENCYQCDLCYQTKCPYVPPHEFNVDFPHLMLRAKAQKFRREGAKFRDRLITSTDMVGKLATIPVVDKVVNAAKRSGPVRSVMDDLIGIHREGRIPDYESNTLTRRLRGRDSAVESPTPTDGTRGRVVLFGTCYCNYNEPEIGEDLVRVFEHNNIEIRYFDEGACCGMPKFDLGDLDSVERLKDHNAPRLARLVAEGWDIVTPIPSCTLMFKQELPLMFPDDADVAAVSVAMFDPFEYLMLRHRAGNLNTDFKHSLGEIAYQVACHQRVQNIGLKTRDVLELVPDTSVQPIERCSGHDGTYTVKSETHESAMKILKPVTKRVADAPGETYTSDCPMAGHHVAQGLADGSSPTHPLTLLRQAYGL